MCNCNIFYTIRSLFGGLKWRQPYFAYSLAMFSANETKDTIGNYFGRLVLTPQIIYYLDAADIISR